MGFYFENTNITGGVPEVLDYLDEQFQSASWTSYHVNPTSSEPSGFSRSTKAYAWRSNGKSGTIGDLPAHHWLGMFWGKDVGINSHLFCQCWSGAKIIPEGTISKTSDTVLVSASEPHNLRTGDILYVHGTALASFHTGWESDDDPLVVTNIVDSNQFNYQDTNGPVNLPTTAYNHIFAIYNAKGSFSTFESTVQFGMGPLESYGSVDNPLNWDVYGYVDEYRMAMLFQIGGNTGIYYGGLTGRGHVPNDWQHCGALTASITGTGGPMLLGLDRACPSMSAGQPIWMIPPNEGSGSKSGSYGSPGRIGPGLSAVTASAKPFDNVVEILVATGAEYVSGTIVGFDPAPCVLFGNDGVNENLTFYNVANTVHPDGTNFSVQPPTFGFEQDTAFANTMLQDITTEGNTDPAIYGSSSAGGISLYYGWDIAVTHANSTNGDRFPLVGFTAWSFGDQNDGDLMVVGQNIAANRWKVFADFLTDNTPATTIIGVGPGAS